MWSAPLQKHDMEVSSIFNSVASHLRGKNGKTFFPDGNAQRDPEH